MDGKTLRSLAESWVISMHAAGLAAGTIEGYEIAVRQYLDYCEAEHKRPDLAAPDSARAWLSALRDAGRSGATRQGKLAALRAFSKWLVAEDELAVSGIHRIEWPRVEESLPHGITEDQIAALIKACDRKTFVGVRDAALLSLMYDAMLRADEALSMRRKTDDYAGDIDLRNRLAHVQHGKGGRERVAAFSRPTAALLDRYERHRARQKYADLAAYWLSLGRGKMSYGALYFMVQRRGERLGLDLHPHMTRSGGAIRWRRRGGSTEGLMTAAGWRDIQMVRHYTRAAESELAIEEAQRLLDGE